MAWAIMGKASLKAFGHSDVNIARPSRIFVSGESKLKNVVSDFARHSEKSRRGLGVCTKRLFWSLFFAVSFLVSQSVGPAMHSGIISPGARLGPVSCHCFGPGHCSIYA